MSQADAPKFNVGDRVRWVGDNGAVEWLVVIETDAHETLTHHYPAGTRRLPTAGLELVEVAHYAPVGVPMIAMTPERIAALETVDGLFRASSAIDDEAPAPTAIRAMLAEARGERAS